MSAVRVRPRHHFIKFNLGVSIYTWVWVVTTIVHLPINYHEQTFVIEEHDEGFLARTGIDSGNWFHRL